MDEFEAVMLTKKEERVCAKVQAQITHCIYCQPYESGEAVWILGDKVDLDSLFEDVDISEESISRIKTHLSCPYCGHSDMSCDSDVGVKTEYEEKVDALLKKAYKTYNSKLNKLISHIEKYPLLVLQDNLAKEIFNEIKTGKFHTAKVAGEFYRVRLVEGSRIFNSEDMMCAPLGKPLEGRFNHSGQSHLYLSNNKRTAIEEVLNKDLDRLVWNQKFEIATPIDNVLDLSYAFDRISTSSSVLYIALTQYSNSVYKNGGNKENWRPDYFLTRFIMDTAKICGYNGIKYVSTKNEWAYNIVLFYPEIVDIKYNEPPVIEDPRDKGY